MYLVDTHPTDSQKTILYRSFLAISLPTNGIFLLRYTQHEIIYIDYLAFAGSILTLLPLIFACFIAFKTFSPYSFGTSTKV